MAGDIVDVKDGYGRNYLIPTGKAVLATEKAKKVFEHQLKRTIEVEAANLEKSKEIAAQLETINVTIAVKAGEKGKIFGTVTNAQIAEALAEKGYIIDRRKIQLDEDVKELGEHTASIHLHEKVKPAITFWVVKAED